MPSNLARGGTLCTAGSPVNEASAFDPTQTLEELRGLEILLVRLPKAALGHWNNLVHQSR